MRIMPITALLLLLGGCASLDQPRFYTLDLDGTRLCRGSSGQCQNLELIGPSYNEPRIAQAYGIPVTARGWSVEELVQLMLSPPEQLYDVQQSGPATYHLPANRATDTVFRYLELEERQLYGGGHKRDD
ncbi:hypothetical protein [Marinobacterium marinum]|uniref:Lipoprotein n=1 Tax=Marinobacterium marinum TaxID=2756129 RepID=A0A7W1WZA1_9GAMM|nr:hypothetical protein [Marinobacterium marinum]MBA4502822.1 hypothetical protein [Marinobacterium marinum]